MLVDVLLLLLLTQSYMTHEMKQNAVAHKGALSQACNVILGFCLLILAFQIFRTLERACRQPV